MCTYTCTRCGNLERGADMLPDDYGAILNRIVNRHGILAVIDHMKLYADGMLDKCLNDQETHGWWAHVSGTLQQLGDEMVF